MQPLKLALPICNLSSLLSKSIHKKTSQIFRPERLSAERGIKLRTERSRPPTAQVGSRYFDYSVAEESTFFLTPRQTTSHITRT